MNLPRHGALGHCILIAGLILVSSGQLLAQGNEPLATSHRCVGAGLYRPDCAWA